MRSLARILVLALVVHGLPARGDDAPPVAPLDATLGDAIPTATLEAPTTVDPGVIVVGAAVALDDDEDEQEFIVLYVALTLLGFTAAIQAVTAEH